MSDNPSISAKQLGRRLAAAGVAVEAAQSAVLAQFVEMLLRWNKVYNLTGVRGLDEIVDRHLVESLALRPFLHGATVADVGSGGGLPGLPLAITEPGRQFTLIESRAKRVRFLRQAAIELGLANVAVAHSRAEHLRVAQPFATVLARAVAPGHAKGAAAGLEAVNACLPLLADSPYGHAAAAAFLAELGRASEARRHFERALTFARTTPKRLLMQRRLESLSSERK